MSSEAAEAVFFNRDLSWIDFNERVLEEGLRQDLPPLDRFRFLSIVSSNFDEFFMVRVAGLKRAYRAGGGPDPAGLSPARQLAAISEKVRGILRRQYRCLEQEVFPALARGGLEFLRPDAYTLPLMDYLESFFMREVYPVLTPLRLEEEELFPAIGNRFLYAAFLLSPDAPESPEVRPLPPEPVAMVRIPPVLNRIILLPAQGDGKTRWALLDDVILTWGAYLFPGFRLREGMLFKINRDADFSVDEKRDEDFIEAMEEVIQSRDTSRVVRMVYTAESRRLRDCLARRLDLAEEDLYEVTGPPDLGSLAELGQLRGFEDLKVKPRKSYRHPAFAEGNFPGSAEGAAGDDPLWERISQGDLLLHVPYQSFDPVVRFFQEAAADPQVISIKTALYRTSGDSPIVKALEEAALNGKHVTALVELKARFDEERNITWANRLERAGVIVVYGLARLKVHAKICLVIRREQGGIKRYVHLATGNYNDRTAKYYEDFGLFTVREDIAYDAGLLFNMITGYSVGYPMRKLTAAPRALKRRLLELIDREAKRSSPEYPGRILAKMNSLADPGVIEALYRASQAGVRVQLIIRGICMLVPGVPGLSDNIRVLSVIDYYLEHSRVFYFSNTGDEEIYLSSADWMPRNLDRRVELMFPVLQEEQRKQILDTLEAYFRDNCQSWSLESGGAWTRRSPPPGEAPFRVQEYLLSQAAASAEFSAQASTQEFIVRRSPGSLGSQGSLGSLSSLGGVSP
jgi:polyphosphate kinase